MTSNHIYTELSSISHNPHFLHRYVSFITAQPNLSSGELHHICPKAKDMFPQYRKEKWNLIMLSPRAHFIAHWLLAKTYGKSQAMSFWAFLNQGNVPQTKEKRVITVTSKTYESARLIAVKQLSESNKGYTMATEISTGNVVRIKSDDFDKNLHRGVNVGIDRSYMKTEEYKQKIKTILKNRRHMVHPEFGYKFAKEEEVDALLQKGYVLEFRKTAVYDRKRNSYLCKYCNKTVDVANFKRWHGENCKFFHK